MTDSALPLLSTDGAPTAPLRPVSAAPGVPLMDPSRVYAQWGPEAETAVVEILRSHAYVKGKHVRGLESDFAAYVGVAHAVAVDSCTDALTLVLRAVLANRPEDCREVILPAYTFVATAGAIVNAGGRPLFADVCEDTQNLDPASVAKLISDRTAAIVPVHLYGTPADMNGLRDVIGERDVFVLEDAAQAIHAEYEGRRAGALADAGTFSFYPSKNLAAAGDAGIVTTDDDELAATIAALRDHGQTRKLYDHDRVGTNSRMDEIQAAVLRLKLPHIGTWTDQRRAVAARYDAAFADTPVVGQAIGENSVSAYHLYTVRVPGRDAVVEGLQARGIACGVYYPRPLHRTTCFASLDTPACPVADALGDQVLSLPCFPGLREDEQATVIEAVRELTGC